jgi:membrane-bound lytic murein transglycosylase D
VVNDYVAGFINYFSNSKGHATLMRSLERAGKYKEMIQRDLNG